MLSHVSTKQIQEYVEADKDLYSRFVLAIVEFCVVRYDTTFSMYVMQTKSNQNQGTSGGYHMSMQHLELTSKYHNLETVITA
jgi:hypothetical protein